MRILAFAVFISLASSLPTASVPNNGEDAFGLTLRDDDGANAITSRSLRPSESITSRDNIRARALYEDTLGWPEDSYTGGTLYYQFQVTSVGSGKFTVKFWNTGPKNGDSYKYTLNAVGAGNDGTLASTILSPASSTSVDIQKLGTQYRVTIDVA